jgi:hypothetical protein
MIDWVWGVVEEGGRARIEESERDETRETLYCLFFPLAVGWMGLPAIWPVILKAAAISFTEWYMATAREEAERDQRDVRTTRFLRVPPRFTNLSERRRKLTSRDEEPRGVESDEFSPVVNPFGSRDGGFLSLTMRNRGKGKLREAINTSQMT